MDLATILEEASDLPSSPELLPRLQLLLRDENADLQDVVSLLKVDAALAAQVVRMANSAYYGRGQIGGLDEAVNRLGFMQVFRVVSTAAGSRLFSSDLPVYKLGGSEMLQKSVATASLMAAFSEMPYDVPMDTAYTTGLLHGLGKVVINAYYLKRGFEFYDLDSGEQLDPELERKILGFDFAEAGAALLEQWKFAPPIVAAIRGQLQHPEDSEQPVLTALLRLAISWAPAVIADIDPSLGDVDLLLTEVREDIAEEDFLKGFADAKASVEQLSDFLEKTSA